MAEETLTTRASGRAPDVVAPAARSNAPDVVATPGESVPRGGRRRELLAALERVREEGPAVGLDIAGLALADVEDGLEEAATRSRSAQSRTYVGLGLLAAIAGISLGAGLIADSPYFWGAAGAVFVLACTGVVAYAAKSLGIFAELATLVKRDVQVAEALHAEATSQLRRKPGASRASN